MKEIKHIDVLTLDENRLLSCVSDHAQSANDIKKRLWLDYPDSKKSFEWVVKRLDWFVFEHKIFCCPSTFGKSKCFYFRGEQL